MFLKIKLHALSLIWKCWIVVKTYLASRNIAESLCNKNLIWKMHIQGRQKISILLLHKPYWSRAKYFEPWLHTLKVLQEPWALVSKQIWNISFIWDNIILVKGCKDIRGQSWRSIKITANEANLWTRAEMADIFFDLQLWPLISFRGGSRAHTGRVQDLLWKEGYLLV